MRHLRDLIAVSLLLLPISLGHAGPINEDMVATRAKLGRLLPGVEEILFVRRYNLQSSHYYTDFIDGCVDFGGNLCALSLRDGTVRELASELSHGIVPVEADGSAHFLVQADKNIFLQALDKNFVEVQRERTFVNFRPGETRSCVGCHEQAQDVSRSSRVLAPTSSRARN